MTEAVRHLKEYQTRLQFEGDVVSNERLTSVDAEAEIRELVLDIDRKDFPFRLGQSVGVIVPGSPEFGQSHHFRMYSVADLPTTGSTGRPRIKIAVRRCFYIDDYSGEAYPGIASNYLCDRQPGDKVIMTGPFGAVFDVPEEDEANLILIGTGTGIAPFRAFVKHIYENKPDWQGRIRLFYGARSGLELLYMNDEKDDFAQYYDKETFKAFQVLSPRPHWTEQVAWEQTLGERGAELLEMFDDPSTYVFIAGLVKMRPELDKVFALIMGSEEKWGRRKAELVAGKRWVELLY